MWRSTCSNASGQAKLFFAKVYHESRLVELGHGGHVRCEHIMVAAPRFFTTYRNLFLSSVARQVLTVSDFWSFALAIVHEKLQS